LDYIFYTIGIKKDFDSKVDEMLQDFELHQKQVQALRLLLEKEEHLHQNIILINEMRRAILYHYNKKEIKISCSIIMYI